MDNFSIRFRLWFFAGIAVICVLTVGSVGWLSTQGLIHSFSESVVTLSKTRNQVEADMMHDAIRSDVLAMSHLMTQPGVQPAQVEEIQKDLSEHIALF